GAGKHRAGAEDWRIAAPGVSWLRDPRQWQFHDEGRPVAFLAGDLDASPVRLDEILRLVETDAPSAALRRPEGGEERVTDEVVRHPPPRIADGKHRPAVLLTGPDRHHSASRLERLRRVGDEVLHHAQDRVRVALNRSHGRE